MEARKKKEEDNNMSDLEQLLEDLGRPKSVAPSKKTRSSVVNLNELEALMTDLAETPAPPRAGASRLAVNPPAHHLASHHNAPAHAPAAASKPPARLSVAASFEADDLDSIMNALNGDIDSNSSHNHAVNASPVAAVAPQQHHQPQPPAATFSPPPPQPAQAPPQPAADRVTSTNTIDELEELLNGLEDTRASVQLPSPAKAPANSNNTVAPASAPIPRTTSIAAAARPAAPSGNSFISSPTNGYGANNNYSAPTSNGNNYSAPANNYSAPANNYSAPANNYSTPANNYSAPANNYSTPANNYAAPANNYSAPAKNYSAPTNNYSAGNNFSANNNYSAPTNSYSPKPAAKPAVRPMPDASLDLLLGDLQEQLRAAPDPSYPASHGSCAACNKPILGEVISALGQRYHPEHFVCGNCRSPLGTSNFYEQDGVPNCERCYQELLCPRCAHCDEPILDRCVTALGKKWHMDHFICTQCLKPFDNGTFFERDSRPFCENCFSSAFAPRCGGCNQAIRGECINALGQTWHPEHFVCHYCQKNFTGSFYDFGGKPYCDVHYHQQTGSLCAGCNKAVSGKCIDALGKKWHPEHFVCAFCMNALAAGSFTENSNKAYCKECHGKLFG